MDGIPRQSAPARRRLPRWARVLLILAVLIGGLALVHRLRYGPRLHVIAMQRLPANANLVLFSANGCGYPVAVEFHAKPPLYLQSSVKWLGADGAPGGVPFAYSYTAGISAGGEVAVDEGSGRRSRKQGVLAQRSGGKISFHLASTSQTLPLFPTDAGGAHDGSHRYYQDGRIALTLPAVYYFLSEMQCADPNYLPVRGPRWDPAFRNGDLALYDLRLRKCIPLGMLHTYRHGMIFSDGRRFVVVYRSFLPGIHDVNAGNIKYGKVNGGPEWWWGEDGSIWQVDGSTVRLLDWRARIPVIRRLPQRSNPDNRVALLSSFWSTPSYMESWGCLAPGIAVWGDGRLVACVETRQVLPPPVARQFAKMSFTTHIPRETRELVLYRNGRHAGWYRLPIDPTLIPLPPLSGVGGYYMYMYRFPPRGRKAPPAPAILQREHLAFNRDGTRLAWVVETAKGKTVYIFKVPESR